MNINTFNNTLVAHHFDEIAAKYDSYKRRNSWYISTVKKGVAKFVPRGKKVFEFGCGTGDVLAYLQPSIGVGMDLSPKMVDLAKRKYPEYTFWKSLKNVGGEFDYIVMVDVIEHLAEPKEEFLSLKALMSDKTRLVMSFIDDFWEFLLMPWEKLGMKMPEGPHRRVNTRKLVADLAEWGFVIEMKTRAWPLFPVTILILRRT